MTEIAIPGTQATLEIDEEALAHVDEKRVAEDFPFADAHAGDNYGKPTLSKGD